MKKLLATVQGVCCRVHQVGYALLMRSEVVAHDCSTVTVIDSIAL
jgi:hypothetical protein